MWVGVYADDDNGGGGDGGGGGDVYVNDLKITSIQRKPISS